MGKEIVVDINPYQTRVVLMDNGSPSDISNRGARSGW